jgi:hypothetical protein
VLLNRNVGIVGDGPDSRIRKIICQITTPNTIYTITTSANFLTITTVSTITSNSGISIFRGSGGGS